MQQARYLPALALLIIAVAVRTAAADEAGSYDQRTKDAALTPAERENYYVGEIIVTGRRVANIEQAGTNTIVDGADIAAHGDRTLAQTLERIPGLQVSMFRKGHARVRLRGFDQRYLLILIDGVPLHDVYSTDLDLNSISVLNVSKIIVNRGVSSALYGTDGAIGTINVITKKPAEPYVDFKTEYGFINEVVHNLTFGAPIGKFYYWVTGTFAHSDGFVPSKKLDGSERRKWFDKVIRYDLYPVDGPFGDGPPNTFDDVTIPAKDQYLDDTGRWDHSAFNRYYLSGKAGYNITPDLEVGVSADFSLFQGETNTYQPNAYNAYRGNQWKTSYPDFSDEQDQVNKFALRNRAFVWPRVHRFGVAPYIRGKKDKFSIKVTGFFLHQGSEQDGYASTDHTYIKGETFLLKGTGVYEPFHDMKTFMSYGVWIFPSYEFAKWHRLNVAFQWRGDQYLGHEQAISPSTSPGIYGLMGAGKYRNEELQAHKFSIAVEDEMRFSNWAKLAVGISYDSQLFTEFKQRQNELYEDVYIVDGDALLFGTRDSFNPVLGVVIDPIKRLLRLRAAAAMKTRFPTLGEYAKVSSEELDEHLKPERAYNANAGFELFFMNKLISLRADYFLSLIDDRIIKVAKDEPPKNMDRTISQGVETIFTAETGKLGVLSNILASASYTYVWARNRDYSEDATVNKGDFLEFTPEHHVTADIRFDFVSETSIDLWTTMAFRQRIYVMDHRPTVQVSDYSTDYFKTIFLHNPVLLHAKIGQRFLKDYEAYFMVRNILDDYNADPFDPGPGRVFYLGLTARWQ